MVPEMTFLFQLSEYAALLTMSTDHLSFRIGLNTSQAFFTELEAKEVVVASGVASLRERRLLVELPNGQFALRQDLADMLDTIAHLLRLVVVDENHSVLGFRSIQYSVRSGKVVVEVRNEDTLVHLSILPTGPKTIDLVSHLKTFLHLPDPKRYDNSIDLLQIDLSNLLLLVSKGSYSEAETFFLQKVPHQATVSRILRAFKESITRIAIIILNIEDRTITDADEMIIYAGNDDAVAITTRGSNPSNALITFCDWEDLGTYLHTFVGSNTMFYNPH